MKLSLVLCLLPALASAQFYNISTIAGNGRQLFGAGGPAVNAKLVEPRYVAVDSSGNLYVSDTYYHQVFQVTPGGSISAYAGNGTEGFSGDGGQATAAQLFDPLGLAVDASGNLYIADTGNYRVRKVTPGGVISTVAALSGGVTCVALDAAGNLYVTGGQMVMKVDSSGSATPFAGNGTAGFAGDGGPATAARFFDPYGLRIDGSGNVFVADQANDAIRKITPQGIISTFAGMGGKGGYTGDGGQAASAQLFLPQDIALDGKGNVYIADSLNGRIRVVNPAGVISTVAGGGTSLQDGAPTQIAVAPYGLAVDNSGNLVEVEYNYRRMRRVALGSSVVTVAGVLPSATAGDGVPATSTALLDPFGVAVDSSGNVYVSDYVDNRIRKISGGIISTIAGNGIAGYTPSGPAASALLGGPTGMSFDPAGNLYFLSGVVQRIALDETISTVAGGSNPGFCGDGGKATSACMLGATDAVADAAGNIYITDRGNSVVRRVDTSGIIHTFAGTPDVADFGGDNGPATAAKLYQPWQLALDNSGNIFLADWGNTRVRKITPAGTISTVAGDGQFGPLGDGGPATSATIGGNLKGIAVDAAGNLYITSNAAIRKVNASTGIISTIAGNGTAGFSGDGGLATNAAIQGANEVAVDSSGNVYFTDETNLRVRKLTPAQIVKEGIANAATSVAGGVAPGEFVSIYAGPGVSLGPATPVNLTLDSSGKVSTMLGGTQVTFDGIAAPLHFVTSGQVNAIVPYEVAGKASTQMQVVVQGQPTNAVTLPVVAASPGVFAITNPDGTRNTPSNPVSASGYLVLYGTGEGQTTPAGVDGQVNDTTYPAPNLPVTVQIGGQAAHILYAGAAPLDVAGVLQVDVLIPTGVTGTVPIQVSVGTLATPAGLTVTVH